jgi:hypothetical protein
VLLLWHNSKQPQELQDACSARFYYCSTQQQCIDVSLPACCSSFQHNTSFHLRMTQLCTSLLPLSACVFFNSHTSSPGRYHTAADCGVDGLQHVARIWVDSPFSQRAGRNIWGIPKVGCSCRGPCKMYFVQTSGRLQPITPLGNLFLALNM